jgi:hypothetical protein
VAVVTTNPFQQAVKEQLRARVAFAGPTGSGKTWTALGWATVLKGDRRVAFIDTERDSAKLYANYFDFDVLRFDPPYEVERLIANLKLAEELGYGVVVVDSLSHFWEGEGGVLDEVDAAGRRSGGNSFAGWKHGTPLQRHMVDTFLALDLHVIVCMRSKMEYVLTDYVDGKGQKKTRPEKVGMAPVQRAGLEYEFTVVGELDLEHRITFTKSRCDLLADKVVQPDRQIEAAETFRDWLGDGEVVVPGASKEALDEFTALVDCLEPEQRTALAEWKAEQGFPWPWNIEQLAAMHAKYAEIVGAEVPPEPEGSGTTSPSAPTESPDPGEPAAVPAGSDERDAVSPASPGQVPDDLLAFSDEAF